MSNSDQQKKYNYIFGPILSRRLGVSLGLDPIPAKTCNLNCVYCECGVTTKHTTKLDNYVDPTLIIAELKEYFDNNPPHIDIVTIAGSGEPTLNRGLDQIISFIRENYPQYKIGILTNSGALINADVRQMLLGLDFVLPSIDAMIDSSFKKINVPAKGLKCSDIIDGVREFAKEYKGNLWVECFILPGVNDTEEELTLFKELFTEIKPTRVQINSMDRPGTCSWVEAPSLERLQEIERFFHPLPVEIISRKAKEMTIDLPAPTDLEHIAETIIRRPLTIEDLSVLHDISINEANEIVEKLIVDKKIERSLVNGKLFFRGIKK